MLAPAQAEQTETKWILHIELGDKQEQKLQQIMNRFRFNRTQAARLIIDASSIKHLLAYLENEEAADLRSD